MLSTDDGYGGIGRRRRGGGRYRLAHAPRRGFALRVLRVRFSASSPGAAGQGALHNCGATLRARPPPRAHAASAPAALTRASRRAFYVTRAHGIRRAAVRIHHSSSRPPNKVCKVNCPSQARCASFLAFGASTFFLLPEL